VRSWKAPTLGTGAASASGKSPAGAALNDSTIPALVADGTKARNGTLHPMNPLLPRPVRRFGRQVVLAACLLSSSPALPAPSLPREAWGAPAVTVTRQDDRWIIAGRRQTVTLNATDLALAIQAGPARWSLVPSAPGDLRVKAGDREFPLRLADAGNILITPYDTGFKTGVKLTLSGWRHEDAALDLTLHLTVCLDGADEELVCDVAAEERGAVVRQLDWPAALDARDVDCTLLPNARGNLLPRHWPKEYHPIRKIAEIGQPASTDTSFVQSNVIECWSMSWWGFQRGRSALMVIVETPDDAAYQFDHPAGGPTVIGPRWRPQLGRLGYLRAARLCFLPEGDYVDMAKRYRRHAQEHGLFVSLREKIARSPAVAELIGTPLTRLSILRNYKEGSFRWDAQDPAKNYRLITFDERAQQLREMKAQGVDKLHVCLTGWPHLGYDRQHPDELPPPPAAGGWEGLKRLADTCTELGYVLSFHDQYRDYYVDAPSYDPQFAVHEEDGSVPAQAFPGSRFGGFKEGRIPFLDHWDGGKQGYLNPRFMLGHLRKNYELIAAHGVRPAGVYLDVFGYVPPDEDFNPQHPATRTQAMRDRADCYNWTRARLGVVGTEAACDWTVPFADISSPIGPGKCVDVPLFNLVYHDAIITTYRTGDLPSLLRGLLNGGLPQTGDILADLEKNGPLIRRMAALQVRLAHVEMTKHEFLDANYRRERTTFADGTTVTVDWDTQTATVAPEPAG
jgi:hypothetical protein